jgi:heptose I phosphotransferase
VHSLHAAHLHHRDLYLGHIFVREEGRGDFRLFLIDLQRVEQRRRLSWRWRIKDLATLNFTAEGMPITRTDRVRFYTEYRRSVRPGTREEAVKRAILRKTAQIGRHTVKLLARRRAQSRALIGVGGNPKT